MTKPIFLPTCLAIFASFIFSACVSGQNPDSKSSLVQVPASAAAFVHVDLHGLSKTRGLQLPMKLVAEIRTELDQVVEKNLGLRPSDLLDLTIVIPEIDASVMELDSTDAAFVLVSFHQSVDVEKVANSLSDWRRGKIKGRDVFIEVKKNLAAYLVADNTLAFGSEKQVKWLVRNPVDEQEGGLSKALKLRPQGHLTLGLNGEKLSPVVAMLPSEYSSLSSCEYAVIGLNLDDGIVFDQIMEFKNQGDATSMATMLQDKIEMGKAALKELEASVSGSLNVEDMDLNSALEPLSMLAVYRFGHGILEDATINQDLNRVYGSIGVKGFDGGVLGLAAVTAIQAIGSVSEATFEEIASELETAEALDVPTLVNE